MAGSMGVVRQRAAAILAAEAAYPGGDLAAQVPAAQRHLGLVADWLDASTAAIAPANATAGPSRRAIAGVRIVLAAQVAAAQGSVLLRDGPGVVLFPSNALLISLDYPLFRAAALRRYAPQLRATPLTAFRWALTDLLPRLTAVNAPVALNVVDYAGDPVLIPYAHGFAIGSGALYTRDYHYAQPTVNVGFDAVALKALAAALSAASGLSYAANISSMAGFGTYLGPLRALLAANGVDAAHWQSLYQASAVVEATAVLTARSRRHFGPETNSTQMGANVARTAYGYAIMKAISRRDSAALTQLLADFALPAQVSVPTISVP